MLACRAVAVVLVTCAFPMLHASGQEQAPRPNSKLALIILDEKGESFLSLAPKDYSFEEVVKLALAKSARAPAVTIELSFNPEITSKEQAVGIAGRLKAAILKSNPAARNVGFAV